MPILEVIFFKSRDKMQEDDQIHYTIYFDFNLKKNILIWFYYRNAERTHLSLIVM